MKCPRCQQENPREANFCLQCGTPLEKTSEGTPPDASYAELQRDLSEALERENATTEILRVISSSPTHLQPVLDAIAERAARLCDAWNGTIVLSDGEALRMETHYGPLAEQVGMKLPIDRGSVSGRAFVEGRPIHVDDLSEAADFPLGRQIAARFGVRTILAVPLVREAVPIGVILIRRTEICPFSDKQIALLKTFADQAVIAIENVRLFKELQEKNRALTQAHAQVSESLEQQTATSEILRVISSSPTDVQPVFDAIAQSAARLCEAFDAVVYRVDGDVLQPVAHHGSFGAGPIPLVPGTVNGRAIIERRLVHVADLQVEGEEFPEGAEISRREGTRSFVSVPLLRGGSAIGTIGVRRFEIRPFSEKQIELLKTFADQAVLAIENVRLFTELQERNRAVTQAHAQVSEALEQQTATSGILRVISSSPRDVQPVFDTIVASAVRLCNARMGALYRFDGELSHLVAHHNYPPEVLEALQRMHPLAPADHPSLGSGDSGSSRDADRGHTCRPAVST
jgi:two-component system NtrC family sensor kinase